jgi:HK97 family phage major capsid protein
MTVDELMERRKAIVAESETDGADLDALENELREINAEIETRKADAAKRAEIREAAVQNGEVKESIEGEKPMNIDEIRSSAEYMDAFANDLKKGMRENDYSMAESRALLTELVSGTVPVPKPVEARIQTNWARLGLMGLVRRTFVPGVLRVGFEKSATEATNHTESTTAVTEETLTLGVVSISPVSIKKWISVSDEVLDLTSEEFLFYIYDEITYQIAKKAQANLIAAITALTASATSTAVSVPSVTGTPSLGVIAEAIGSLGDDAANPVVVMNKATWAQFKAAQYQGNYNIDPFEGLSVYYDNTLPAYTSTGGTTGSAWAIVGDFGIGAVANFPAGEDVTLKYDDLSLAEKDLVKIVGREYVGIGIVHCDAFAKIVF